MIDRSKAGWGEEILKLTEGRGIDVVVDNVGVATIGTSLKATARGGRIVVVGNTSGPVEEIDLRYIFNKQIRLIGSTMGTHQDFLFAILIYPWGESEENSFLTVSGMPPRESPKH
ncbi:MAG: zinc-binding dehydrogenase [Syntrophobacteraceae bacterium]